MAINNNSFFLNNDFLQYEELDKLWEVCADCYGGTPLIKHPNKILKYLPPSKRERDDFEEHRASRRADLYAFRADHAIYENIFKPVVDDCVGLMQKNEAIIRFGVDSDEESEKEVREIAIWGTKYNDGLKGLKWRVNHNQALYGRYGLLLDVVTEDDNVRKRIGLKPRFVISEYPAYTILEGEEGNPRAGGWGTTEWVRLDESYMKYDRRTKIRRKHERYRILGLDNAGNYYQALFDGDEANNWRKIDIGVPHLSNPTDLIYPRYKGKNLNFIPFTVCNVNRIGFNNWQYPPFLDVAFTAIGMFQVDSIYKKALWNHATPTLTVCNVEAKESDSTLYVGDALFLNSSSNNPASASLLETSGSGLVEMRSSKNEMKASLKYSSLRDLLDDAGSNSSGSAIELRTTSGTACIASIDKCGALAIEEQLIYASIWSGATPEEAGERISYEANTNYLSAAHQLQSIVSLFNANEQTSDGRKILSRQNRFNILKGLFPYDISSYDDNEKQLEKEAVYDSEHPELVIDNKQNNSAKKEINKDLNEENYDVENENNKSDKEEYNKNKDDKENDVKNNKDNKNNMKREKNGK